MQHHQHIYIERMQNLHKFCPLILQLTGLRVLFMTLRGRRERVLMSWKVP